MQNDSDLARHLAQNIEVIIFDVDNCLFDYPTGYAERFSRETARAAKLIAQRMINGGSEDEKIIALALEDEDVLTECAVQSYAEHGKTTEYFCREYGLCDEDLYNEHHYLICRDVVQPTFGELIDTRLQKGMENLKQSGMRMISFTDGTEYYCNNVVSALGLKNAFDECCGIDSNRPKDWATKSRRTAWIDLIEKLKIPSKSGYVIGETNKPMFTEERDWSHVLLIDDTPEKLKAAKFLGITTLLRATERVGDVNADYIDGTIQNLGAFTNAMAAERLFSNSGQKSPQLRVV